MRSRVPRVKRHEKEEEGSFRQETALVAERTDTLHIHKDACHDIYLFFLMLQYSSSGIWLD